ncbi:cysteine desulfurase [Babesia gibsoni]|uniref:cysteine desulfurase n=1 Tax=Babesia gibsoni TaxID=33632 RepID=A0AAD8LLU2_BABGI|nr:cysteine desulfurase [Babesia gibsoni]
MQLNRFVACLLATHSLPTTESVSVIPRAPVLFIKPETRARVLRNAVKPLSVTPDDSPIVDKREFPAFNVPGAENLIYFDNAATTQKPRSVLDGMLEYYTNFCSNIHRSQHKLGFTASARYEHSREKVAEFINANSASEIVFTSGATDSINLVANTWCTDNVKKGDAILLPISEHNSNIVPWQLHAQRSHCDLHFIKITQNGDIDLDDYLESLKKGNVKLVSISHASNVLGNIQPLKHVIRLAHEHGAKVMVDACQTLAHIKVNVRELDCDFLVGSAHKLYGPTGIGFLYAKKSILESMPVWKGGGGMIEKITCDGFTVEDIPHRFESGTPPVAQAIGLSEAIDFINKIGMQQITSHEHNLTSYLFDKLIKLGTVYTTLENIQCGKQCAILAFNVDDVNAFDLSTFLSMKNIALRAGQHCAHILHQLHLRVEQTLRVSLAMYNTKAEVDIFINQLCEAVKALKEIKER